MKTLHTYLVGQILASMLMTVAVFTFVLLLGNALKEILPLLVNGQVSFGVVAQAVGLLVPFVWVFALPMGMLTATLLIFGRFSADQELTAVRASGVSLLSLVSPVLLLSLACCALSALINMEVGPRCRILYTSLLTDLKIEFSNIRLPEGQYIRDFKDCIICVGKNRRGGAEGVRLLEDVTIFQFENETNVLRTIHARTGTLEKDKDSPNQQILVRLFDASWIDYSGGQGKPGVAAEIPLQLPLGKHDKGPQRLRIDDMTFSQLLEELHDLQKVDLPIGRRTLTREQLHIHRQVAFSFACFGFTLIGIPLGIRVHRRETNIGIAIALVLVAFYYLFILVGQAMASRPEWSPYLIVWAPNFLFQSIGAVLLWRANRMG